MIDCGCSPLIPGRPVPSGGGGGGGGGVATTGFGGNPPASLTNSVKQLETLTSEVGKIRESLLQIERPAGAADTSGGPAGRGGQRGLVPITPDRRAGAAVARPRKLKGLAGVIAARNERDKKRMDELVKLVQSSLGAMENSLEARLEKLESRVGEVNELSGALGGKKAKGTSSAAAGGARSGATATDPSEATRLRALELYNGYLGKETNVACNLMEGLSTDFQDHGQEDEAEAFTEDAQRIRQNLARNMDGEVEITEWCD